MGQVPTVAYFAAMDTRTTPPERAFELAKSGTCASVPEIKHRLKSEGHSVDQITGGALIKQLKALIQTTGGKKE